ncbi:hypothetical protein [Clostridium psychrophilum]|uniref:hypothetical protein n=1 Tax=Clostridium psychrophilum TaxID=132926 RepID=UPI001C0DAB98|nr:hypothetical protein [Clostridium psychrophilum]MBU3181418.1 hypothetical protein [Clostridium psychrophilum]
MGYNVTMDNHKERYNIQLTNKKGCTYCKEGKQISASTGDSRWHIDDVKNEIQSDSNVTLVETIKINYCPMCGRKLI